MSATYVYCLVQADVVPRLAGVRRGLPRTGRPRALALDTGLWLVVSDAPVGQYGQKALERSMKDLDWVSRCALAHERVVESFLGTATAIPFRLFTLFRDDARALASMERRRRTIRRLLSKLAGAQEWGVRVHIEREPRLPSTAARRPGESRSGRAVLERERGTGRAVLERKRGAGRAFLERERGTGRAFLERERGAGRAFLERKRRAELERRSALLEAVACAKSAYGRLESLAAEARRHDACPASAGAVLLDAAFLVRTSRTEAFRLAVADSTRRLRGLGCAVVATGPWPPYSFVSSLRSTPCDDDRAVTKS